MLANEAFFIIAMWHEFVSSASSVGAVLNEYILGPDADLKEMSESIAKLKLDTAELFSALAQQYQERKVEDEERLRHDMDIISSMVTKEQAAPLGRRVAWMGVLGTLGRVMSDGKDYKGNRGDCEQDTQK